MNSRAILKLDWATHRAAKFACQNWHYSGTLPVPPLVRVGVWEDDVYIGCVVFSRGPKGAGSRYGLRDVDVCELSRVALRAHKNSVSRIIKIALMLLCQQNPGLRLVISYADPKQNHVGSVYQAGNWVYAGKTHPTKEFIFQGRKYHERQVSKTGRNKQFGQYRNVPRIEDCEVVYLPGKHRYLYPLDDRIKKIVSSLAQPYPKRAKQAMAGPPAQRRCNADPHAPMLDGLDAKQ